MIFISYRKSDSKDFSRLLAEKLISVYGEENIFFDSKSIPLGADYKEKIKKAQEKAKIILAPIGKEWLQVDEWGNRRIDSTSDILRFEIENAFEKKTPVIPLYINSFEPPSHEIFQNNFFLSNVFTSQGLPFDLDRDLDGLIKKIEKYGIEPLKIHSNDDVEKVNNSSANQAMPEENKYSIFGEFINSFIPNMFFLRQKYIQKEDALDSIKYFVPVYFIEPGRTVKYDKRINILRYLSREIFNLKGEQFFLLLADSGMGKTTLMLMIFRRLYQIQARRLRKPKFNIRYIPFGEAYGDTIDIELDSMIKEGSHKKTILLLDGFDEDPNAIKNYSTRFEQLKEKIIQFHKVVISCRTQYFPTEADETKRINILKHTIFVVGESQTREFKKIAVLAFDNKSINRYLRNKYPLFGRKDSNKLRARAREIINGCDNLSSRPMILRFIDHLVTEDKKFQYLSDVYESIINIWVERESHKLSSYKEKDDMLLNSSKKEQYTSKLKQFIRDITLHMYKHRNEGYWISSEKIKELSEKYEVENLNEVVFRTRSLLNRNADHLYKFSHKSILEYQIAVEINDNSIAFESIDFNGIDKALDFYNEMCWIKFDIKKKAGEIFNLYSNQSIKHFLSKTYELRAAQQDEAFSIITKYDNLSIRGELFVNDFLKLYEEYKLYDKICIVEFLINHRLSRTTNILIPKLKNILVDIARKTFELRYGKFGYFISENDIRSITFDYDFNWEEFLKESQGFLAKNIHGNFSFVNQPIFEYFLAYEMCEDPEFKDQFPSKHEFTYLEEFHELLFWKRSALPYLRSLNGIFNEDKNMQILNPPDFNHVVDLLICNETQIDIKSLHYFKNLFSLTIHNSTLINESDFKELNSLRHLSLVSCGINNLEFLREMHELRFLNFSGILSSRKDIINSLKNIKEAPEQDFENHIVDIRPLEGLYHIYSLTIDIIEPTYLSSLGEMKKLEQLSLSIDKIDTSDFSQLLSKFEALKKNIFSDEKADNEKINQIENSTNISQKKKINNTADLSFLMKLNSLKQLTLKGYSIQNIDCIENLSCLEQLSLQYTLVSEIQKLCSLSSLKEIIFYQNRISKEGIDKLQQALPNCIISTKHSDTLLKGV